MSYSNFIPELWAQTIVQEREKMMAAVSLCNRDYEGEIKEVGDKVKINAVSRPTIVDYDDEKGIGEFEKLKDQSTMLEITECKGFHFYVGDIDKRQAKGDLMNAELTEAAAALAEVMDSYVYSIMLKEKGAIQPVVNEISTNNVLHVISTYLGKMWANNVPTTEPVSIEVSSQLLGKLQMAKLLNDTDNSELLKRGMKGRIGVFNAEVKLSNNLPVYDKTGEYFIIRSKKAVSFAEQLKEVKAYEPQNFFGEAVKGLQVYGAKVIRPKELIIVPVGSFKNEM